MATTRTGWWMIGVLVVISALALGWQRYDTSASRVELQLLREESRELTQLRAENQRLVKNRMATADLEKLQSSQAALQKLRVEIETLRAHAAKAETAAAAGPRIAPEKNEMRTVETLRNVGRADPRAAGETFVWALQRGDVELAASLLAFTPEARAMMEAILKTVPPNVSAEYGTPEKLMAFVMAGTPSIAGFRVLGESQDEPNVVTQRLELLGRGGGLRQDSVRFERGTDGWRRLIQPQTVEKLGEFIKERKPEKG